MFLNNEQVTEEIKRETKEFIETNDSGNMTTHNLFDTAKAVLRGKFVVGNTCTKKKRMTQRYLKEQEKEE